MLTSKANPPDFLVIGAQKSATTWLWKCLREHPSLYFPPKKELHYFDRSTSYPSPSILSEASPLKRYTNDRDLLHKTITEISKKSTSLKEYTWFLKYYFMPCNPNWYNSLFTSRKSHQLAGEVTPSYAILDVEDIQKIYAINNHMRIVYILRNPIDRAWSAFLMKLRKRKIPLQAVSDRKAIKYFNSETCNRKSDYYHCIRKWRSVFSTEQMHIDYYDKIIEVPETLLNSVVKHIGAPKNTAWNPSIVNSRFNEGLGYEIPDRYYHYLYTKYEGLLHNLHDLLDHETIKKWIDQKPDKSSANIKWTS